MSKTKLVAVPPHFEDGFIWGKCWTNKQRVAINVNRVSRIDIDCGNQPPANRLHFIDGTPHLDLIAEMVEVPADE